MYGRTPILPEQLFDLVYIWGINIKVFLVGEGSSAAKTRMLEKHSYSIGFNTFLPERGLNEINLLDPEIQQAGFILHFLCFLSLNKHLSIILYTCV